MSVNGITGAGSVDAYSAYASTPAKTETEGKATQAASETTDSGVIYEKSAESADTAATTKTYKSNPELVAKLKADAEQRTAQLRSLVEQLITKQGTTFGIASDDEMWKFLASGNFTVDAATKAQAQADIADDGYWGVEQTSDRILDFAKALSGGDPDKMDEMEVAFEKGFKQATGAWGKDLPSISQKTYDAVKEKFQKFREEQNKTDAAAKADTTADETTV